MYQQPMPQPRDEYERRNSSYTEPGSSTGYDEGYKANPQSNDQMADAIAQRLRYEFRTGMPPSTAPSAGHRLSLAIVSVEIVVALFRIILGLPSLIASAPPLPLFPLPSTITALTIHFNF